MPSVRDHYLLRMGGLGLFSSVVRDIGCATEDVQDWEGEEVQARECVHRFRAGEKVGVGGVGVV